MWRCTTCICIITDIIFGDFLEYCDIIYILYCLPQLFMLFLIIWQTNCILGFSRLTPAWLDLHISVLGLDKFCGFGFFFKFVFIWSYSQRMVFLPPDTNVPYHVGQYCFFFMCYWLWSFNILAVIQILHCALVPRGGQRSDHVVCELLPPSQKVTHQEWD